MAPPPGTKYMISAVALLAVAFGIWQLDLHGLICDPESLLQGHGAWHILDAGAAYCMFLYYYSEFGTIH